MNADKSEKSTEETGKKKRGRKLKLLTIIKRKRGYLIICGVLLTGVLIVFCAGMKYVSDKKEKNQKKISCESTLEKIINVEDLYTFQAIYDGVAEVRDEKNPEQIDIYVAYKAKVNAGLTFSELKPKVDDEKNEIRIKIPEIKVMEPDVDITQLDYMFLDKSANTENVSARAYSACVEDVKNESTKEDAIYELAKQNAINSVKALSEPFCNQIYPEYDLIVE